MMGICEHSQGIKTVPRTMDSWKRGLLTNDLSELRARATEGDTEAKAQLDALDGVVLRQQFLPPG